MEIDSQQMQRNQTDEHTHHIGTDILEAKPAALMLNGPERNEVNYYCCIIIIIVSQLNIRLNE